VAAVIGSGANVAITPAARPVDARRSDAVQLGRFFWPAWQSRINDGAGRRFFERRDLRPSFLSRFPSSQVTRAMKKFVGKHVVIAALSGIAAFAASAQAADVVGNAKAGQGKVAMCIGCHGIADYRTAYPEVYRVPILGGQNATYLANALHAYKKGDRHFDTMRAITASLSDQDIADIAAYYAAQTATSKNNPDK
jgi:cytochrome c553